LAKIPPTLAAAKKINSGLSLLKKLVTCSEFLKSNSLEDFRTKFSYPKDFNF